MTFIWRMDIRTVPTQQHRRRAHTLPVGHLDDRVSRHERAARAAQRTVRRHVDALFLAEIDNLLLRQRRVVLDLVDGRDDGRLRQKLLQVPLAVVRHADGLDLARGQELLHVLPGLDVVVGADQVARAVRQLGEEGVVS